jgi:Na+-translocating ferredoxin:NAD+ oxidoreductase RNF subunit RnfB
MDYMAIVYAVIVLTGIGVLFSAALGYADKKFSVEVDERAARVREALAGANCGACGFAGCDAFADALVKGKAKVTNCPVSNTANVAKALGVEAEEQKPRVARVLCQGTTDAAKPRYAYDGLKSCKAAAGMAGGPKQCRFSCIGLGDCEAKCKFGAIEMRNGIAYIDEEKCTGCTLCVAECPRNIIEMTPRDASVIVRCKNKDSGKLARAVCEKACIACLRCEKACKYGAIKVENNLARIDYEKCTRCGECAAVCPTKCITIEGK